MNKSLVLTLGMAALIAAGLGWQIGFRAQRAEPASQVSQRNTEPGAPAQDLAGADLPPPEGVCITHQMQADLLKRVERMEAISLAAWATRLVREPGARDTLCVVMDHWAALAPKEAYQFFKRWPVPGLAVVIYDHLAAADPSLAVTLHAREVERLGSLQDFWAAFDALGDSLCQLPRAEIMALMQRSESNVRAALARQFALRDPTGGKAFIEGLPSGVERERFRKVFLANWQTDDPASAARYAMQQKDLPGVEKNELLEAWLNKDPTGSAQWLLAPENRWLLGGRMYFVLKSIPAENFSQARQIAQSLSGRNRTEAMTALGEHWAQTNMTEALALSSELPESRIRRDTVTSLVQQWSAKDLPAATTYLLKIPDAKYRTDGQMAIANGLTDHRREDDAVRWTQALPPEERQRLALQLQEQHQTESSRPWIQALLKSEKITP